MTDGAEPSGVKSSLRTLEILEYLGACGERRSIAAMSRDLGIPKSSLHGLLRTMAARGWLETDAAGTGYGIGLRALLAGAAYVETDDLVPLANGALDLVSERSGETVHLGRLDGGDIVYLAKRESRHALRLFSAVGRRLPAHATALGKALLAQLGDDEVEERLGRPFAKLTPTTITDPAELHAELAATRQRGYAIDRGENSAGILCVAVALRPVQGTWNAISCSVPESRMTDEHRDEIIAALEDARVIVDSLTRRLAS
ncbi:IclR family transcriptional regulator [Agromyces larvae]|uniref:IclR family transcriptional regulator n=1 Tax=Agromyces larvae TaxID=2929802 RepID=A0ABY4C229_9MICO|nr:IclR family transcriptional regulator [Agromyces larvae]UOE45074.1 IclR family transcriptional regulator [Agromyces larvae]